MTKPTIYADFNNADSRGRLRLNTVGTLRDLAEKGVRLYDGLTLRLQDEELEADGDVSFSTEENLWVAAIDWEQVQSVEPTESLPTNMESD